MYDLAFIVHPLPSPHHYSTAHPLSVQEQAVTCTHGDMQRLTHTSRQKSKEGEKRTDSVFVCACVRFFPSTLLVKVGGGSNQTSLAELFSSFFLYSTHPRHTHSPTFVFATPHSLTPAGLADHLHTAIQKDTYSNYKPLVLAIS